MGLQEEIEAGRQTVKADAYPMSIGEMASLYRNRELVIRPEFQRLFRWSIEQKSRLIESIFLGIPLPSIFVMQRHDGVWEVIDGLQRLSTILEFMGELLDEETGKLRTASTLRKTRYLPSLNNLRYEDEDGGCSLTTGQRIAFKRSKLDFKILLPESDEKAKYELFDRLNSGGESPSAQEVRNAQIIMRDRSLFEWIYGLSNGESFSECVAITSNKSDEQYDVELVCRFMALMNTSDDRLKSIDNVDSFLTERVLEFAEEPDFDREGQQGRFERLFTLLASSLGAEAFRRYDENKAKFLGGFLVSAYEAITVGIATNLTAWEALGEGANDAIRERAKTLWSMAEFRSQSGSGVRGTTRIPAIVPVAKRHFKP
ncbi:DUF262 domain-containing protein [Nonomuraea sp. NBC_01738]|uniref:DUF262 domain-containing protein n=1 Tax=Nonomuraea sp. NBC_01738 TaxID=2976003 RepID=UPI002E159E8C|nr:DUF262 domain-containing protein [Nonomuraea sp. NBC_01738]